MLSPIWKNSRTETTTNINDKGHPIGGLILYIIKESEIVLECAEQCKYQEEYDTENHGIKHECRETECQFNTGVGFTLDKNRSLCKLPSEA